MVSGHGVNLIFFNKEIKIGPPKHLLTPTPLHPVTSHFCFSPHPLSQSGRHMCITPKEVRLYLGLLPKKLSFRLTYLKVRSRVWHIFWQLKTFWKWQKVLFISPQKLFSFFTWETLFSKNHAQNMVEKVAPDLFQNN